MTTSVKLLPRCFNYNGVTLPDPNPNFSPEQVREILTPTYPELATAALEGPVVTGEAIEYTFIRAVGPKG